MMDRRRFLLTSLAGALGPLAAEAQRGKTSLIGVLSPWGPSPGGNVTGLTIAAEVRIEPKQLELLKEAVSGLARVGGLANRRQSGDPPAAQEYLQGSPLSS